MTGEKKTAPAVVLVASIVAWIVLALAAVWHVQNDGVGNALVYAVLSLAPAAVAYEVLRRWNRG